MDEIAQQLDGGTTGSNHPVRAEPQSGGMLVWYLQWADDDPRRHDHMCIARIERRGDGFLVSWLRGTDPSETYQTDLFATEAAVVEAVKAETARR